MYSYGSSYFYSYYDQHQFDCYPYAFEKVEVYEFVLLIDGLPGIFFKN